MLDYPTVAKPTNRLPIRPLALKPGDLVVTRADACPTLLEVIRVERDGLVRVRGLQWSPGYSVLTTSANLRPVSGLAPPGRDRA